MNAPRKNFKTIIIALLVVLLAVNTVQLVQVKNELHHLRNDYMSMYNTINNRVTNVQNTLTRQTNEIREILDEQESLFASTGVDVSYQDRKLSVTISAVPKELKSSETLWASLSVNGETITQQFDASGKAVIPLEPTVTSFVPTVQIKSPAGVKQQVQISKARIRSLKLSYFVAFLEGIITFISPCILPMLSLYMSYFANGENDKKKTEIRINIQSIGLFPNTQVDFILT